MRSSALCNARPWPARPQGCSRVTLRSSSALGASRRAAARRGSPPAPRARRPCGRAGPGPPAAVREALKPRGGGGGCRGDHLGLELADPLARGGRARAGPGLGPPARLPCGPGAGQVRPGTRSGAAARVLVPVLPPLLPLCVCAPSLCVQVHSPFPVLANDGAAGGRGGAGTRVRGAAGASGSPRRAPAPVGPSPPPPPGPSFLPLLFAELVWQQ